MCAGLALLVMARAMGLSWCGLFQGQDLKSKALDQTDAIPIVLDANQPDLSKGVLYDPKTPIHFKVGFGRYGIACAGSTFQ